MPVKNKIHNTQKAGGFRLKRAPEDRQRGGLPGRIIMVKKDKHSKKTRRQTTVRFILVRHIGRPRA